MSVPLDTRAALVVAQNRNRSIAYQDVLGNKYELQITSVANDAVIGRVGNVSRIVPFTAIVWIEVFD